MKVSQRRSLDLLSCAAILAAAVSSAVVTPCRAVDSWASFRNGGSSRSSSPLPTHWTPTTGIAWQAELAGYGQSAPVIHGDRVIVTSVLGDNCEQVSLQCFELSSGRSIWSFRHASSVGHPSNYMNSRAAPTPIVDENGVYAFFETGDFVGLDWEGKLLWHRDETEQLGKFQNNHGLGSSPAADEDTLYVLIEHDGPSSLIAVNKRDGETRWSAERVSTKSWASPILASVSGASQVIVSSGGTVTAYDPVDGNQLWSRDGVEGNSVPSPVVDEERLILAGRLPEFATDGQVQANCVLDLSRVKDGQPRVLWRANKAICDYASPVVCGGYVYFINKADVLHCIAMSTGDVAYRERLSLDCWATPIVSGDLIYCFGKSGETKIVRSGPTFKEVTTNALWDVSNPPLPLRYAESPASDGGHAAAGDGVERESPSGPGASMVARMLAGDKNGDGVLERDEVPTTFRPMIDRIDKNGDDRIDPDELKAMAKSFAERRKNAAASARDPIVYGVAAADGRIVIRTGTRLYVVGPASRTAK